MRRVPFLAAAMAWVALVSTGCTNAAESADDSSEALGKGATAYAVVFSATAQVNDKPYYVHVGGYTTVDFSKPNAAFSFTPCLANLPGKATMAPEAIQERSEPIHIALKNWSSPSTHLRLGGTNEAQGVPIKLPLSVAGMKTDAVLNGALSLDLTVKGDAPSNTNEEFALYDGTFKARLFSFTKIVGLMDPLAMAGLDGELTGNLRTTFIPVQQASCATSTSELNALLARWAHAK